MSRDSDRDINKCDESRQRERETFQWTQHVFMHRNNYNKQAHNNKDTHTSHLRWRPPSNRDSLTAVMQWRGSREQAKSSVRRSRERETQLLTYSGIVRWNGKSTPETTTKHLGTSFWAYKEKSYTNENIHRVLAKTYTWLGIPRPYSRLSTVLVSFIEKASVPACTYVVKILILCSQMSNIWASSRIPFWWVSFHVVFFWADLWLGSLRNQAFNIYFTTDGYMYDIPNQLTRKFSRKEIKDLS